MTCRWDRDASDYLRDGDPCRRDDYGDPTNHCTAKKTCSHHIAPNEQTCGRCMGDFRNNIRATVQLAALMPIEALTGGVNSEAAVMAGPAADYRVFTARRALDRRWIYEHIPDNNIERAMTALLADDDAWHPFNVLTKWHWLISADYGHDLPEVMTVADSAAYLERNLPRIAQDADQEFAKLKSEVEKVRKHLESVIHNSQAAEKGAPCPDCASGLDKTFVRLVREYGHWCDDEACEKVHYPTDEGDRWVCPKDRDKHVWTVKAYRDYIEERTA